MGHLSCTANYHDDVIKWKRFPRYWPLMRWIHRSPVDSIHKGKWRGTLMVSLICVWTNDWLNTRYAGNLSRHHAHYDVTVNGCKCAGCVDRVLATILMTYFPWNSTVSATKLWIIYCLYIYSFISLVFSFISSIYVITFLHTYNYKTWYDTELGWHRPNARLKLACYSMLI